MYMLVGVNMPYSMDYFAQAPAHLMVTRCVASGAFYKAKDSGAHINSEGGV